jgi:hypothetical protein
MNFILKRLWSWLRPMQVELHRIKQDQFGTHGQLYLGDTFLCYTEELPWDDNEPDHSCIPAGTYNCTPHNSYDHPGTWQVNNVPNRTNVLIHTGNTEADTLGCILVGMILSTQGVYNSVAALAHLHETLPDTFTLIIKDNE